jgi:pterin-4a-carbinolamine dehydratase
LIAKDPAMRFQTMKEVQAALEAFATIVPTGRVTITLNKEEPKRKSDPAIREIGDQTLTRSTLDPQEAKREVKALGKRWSLTGDALNLDVYNREMAKLASVVDKIAALADEMDHAPEISIKPPHLRLTIPDATTVVALVFAARIEQWLREQRL